MPQQHLKAFMLGPSKELQLANAEYMNRKLAATIEGKPCSNCEFSSASPVALSIGMLVLLDILELVETNAAATDLATHKLEIKVEARGVNFRDCTSSMRFGFKCSYIVYRIGSHATKLKVGDRVFRT
ncbi:BcPKS21, polyketide synthase [Sclerotinia borealis F-4128]|uniref:BcPKS21, polyketide synthase n=1 Tax=Sclerotinia borealis (strain F-4128) TaxID=1432307 RepID=W9CIF2_SCLBF|nr:BcPKS21, polyketide synthase [Sclerotinia borealis F-4128]